MSSKLNKPLLEWYHDQLIDKVGDSGAIEEHTIRNPEEEKAASGREMSRNNSSESANVELRNLENEINNNSNNDETKEEDDEDEGPKKCNWFGWIIRIFIILCLAGLAVWAIIDSDRLTGIFEDFIDWMQDNPILAPFVFICVYVFATIFFLPGLILTLGAGFAFNEAYGNQGGKLKLYSTFL